MIAKWTTALFLAGTLLAPAAAYAADATPTAPTAAHKAKETIGDAAITTKVKAKFAADRDVSAMNIKVDTDNGVVTLSGNAKSQDEANKAAEIAKGTDGVTTVNNDIRVNPAGAKY